MYIISTRNPFKPMASSDNGYRRCSMQMRRSSSTQAPIDDPSWGRGVVEHYY